MPSYIQLILFQLGCLTHRNAGKILFRSTLVMITLCIALKSVKIETNLDKLWIENDGRVGKELNYIQQKLGSNYGTSSQVVIQTPKLKGDDVLNVNSFVIHLTAMQLATQVAVDMFGRTWNLKDICYSPSVPTFDGEIIDQILEKIIPCAIKTPLDCFWEGSKLLGPYDPVIIPQLGYVKWTSLNPSALVDTMRQAQLHSSFDYSNLVDWMKRSGIKSAYQNKPCLVPSDPSCPVTAPNKNTGIPPDIGVELTNGCYGFAQHQMYWHESEIVGGVKKNKTGFITEAEALQSTVQLMADQEMFEFWKGNYKVNNLDWSVEKAKVVLEAWQRNFSEKLNEFTLQSLETEPFDVYATTSTSIDKLMDNFSSIDYHKLIAGYLVIFLYTCIFCPIICLSKATSDTDATTIESPPPPRSSPTTTTTKSDIFQECNSSTTTKNKWSIYERITTIVMASLGLIYIGLTLAASLGFCVLLGLSFNAATSQLLPFLALCLGYHDLMILFQVLSRNTQQDIHIDSLTGECLSEMGPGIMISSISCIASFLAASIIPVPALRTLSIQAIIFLIFNLISIMVIIPSIFDLILRANSSNDTKLQIKIDKDSQILSRIKHDLMNVQSDSNHGTPNQPCFDISAKFNSNGMSTTVKWSSNNSTSNNARRNHQESNHEVQYNRRANNLESMNKRDNSYTLALPDVALPKRYAQKTDEMDDDNLNQPRTTSISPLNLSACDIRGPTDDHKFSCTESMIRAFAKLLASNSKIRILFILVAVALFLFMATGIPGIENNLEFSDMVPKDTLEYKHMTLRRKYFPIFNAFAVTKDNFDYSTSQKLLHEYYQALNKIDGIDKDDRAVSPNFWLILFREWLLDLQKSLDYDRNISAISIDGWTSEASDSSILAYKLIVQTGDAANPIDKNLFNKARLVDSEGIINPKAFYNYLTAWVSNDAFTYSLSEANFRPAPDQPEPWIHDPKDVELKIPKSKPLVYAQSPYIIKMKSTSDILKTITDIRKICNKFEQRRLPNFPSGIPFAFWEQFFQLNFHLATSLVVTLASTFAIVILVTFDIRISSLVLLVSLINVIELYGMMGLATISFNAIQAVALTIVTGMGVAYSIHIVTTFMIAEGTKEKRTIDTVSRTYRPILRSWICTSVGTLVMMLSQFDYIFKFTLIIQGSVVFNAINSLIIIPIILASFGPKSVPNCNHQTARGASITAEMRYKLRNMPTKHFKRRSYPRVQSEISLSTISEEPNPHQSQANDTHSITIRCY